jgi:hypothetical protein
MKVPIPITCPACGEKFPLEVAGSNLPKYSRCPKCGAQPYNMWPLGNVVTKLLMERAKQELANGDMTLSMLLSAVAVEAEMAYLFFKWKAIDAGKLPSSQTAEDKKKWEHEWGEMRSIKKRLDNLSRLLTDKPFDEFGRPKMGLLKSALTGWEPDASIKDFFQDQFFKRRNDIAHYGEIDLEKPVAERCLSLANALLDLLHAMDTKRIQVMEEAHRKARENAQTTHIEQ